MIDPAQGINERMDIAISDGKIEDVAHSISDGNSSRVIDATGLIVTPGLIDINAHVAIHISRMSVDPDEHCLRKGSTTVVDSGTTGELNFTPFKEFVMRRSRTRILAFLNIESLGMVELGGPPAFEVDQRWPKLLTTLDELFAPLFVNLKNTVRVMKENTDSIVGITWFHHGLYFLARAREVADEVGCPLYAENTSMPDALKFLRKGDVITNIYRYSPSDINGRYDGMTEDGKNIHPEYVDAVRKRGVLLDLGHGRGAFSWRIARLAFEHMLRPNTISNDLWAANVAGPVHDLPTSMSKCLHLGMSLEDVVRASTAMPAQVIGKPDEIGSLKPGSAGDLITIKVAEGKFPLTDSYGVEENGERKLIPADVVRAGEILVKSEA